MKNLLSVCLMCLVISSCQKKNIKDSDLLKENLKENVVGIISVGYKATEKFGEPTKGELSTDFSELNFVETYNKEGNTEEHISLYGMEKLGIYKYHYNELGKRDYLDIFNPDGSLNSKFRDEYDPDGKIKNVKQYDGNGKLMSTKESIYNEQNQLVKETTSYPVNEAPVNPYTTVYEYQGDSIKTVSLVGSNGLTFEYEKFKNSRKIVSMQQKYLSEFEYNEFGDISVEKMSHVNSNSKIILIYKYKYDIKGNWVELVKYGAPDIPNYDKLHPMFIIYRTIFYDKGAGNLNADSILNNSIYKAEYDTENARKLQEKYCNEAFVREKVIEYFKLKLPEWTPLSYSINITPLENCKFKIDLIAQLIEYKYNKRHVEFIFAYEDDYSAYNVIDLKETKY